MDDENNYEEILEEVCEKLNNIDSVKELDVLDIKNSVESIENLITDTQAKLNFEEIKGKLENIAMQVDSCNDALLKDLYTDINTLKESASSVSQHLENLQNVQNLALTSAEFEEYQKQQLDLALKTNENIFNELNAIKENSKGDSYSENIKHLETQLINLHQTLTSYIEQISSKIENIPNLEDIGSIMTDLNSVQQKNIRQTNVLIKELQVRLSKFHSDFENKDFENQIAKISEIYDSLGIINAWIEKVGYINQSIENVYSRLGENIDFDDVAEKIPMLQGSSVYAKEIKDDILELKTNVYDSGILEIINMIIEILDFIMENSVQLEEQMTQTLRSGIEYCASPDESIDGDLIVQQLEIMKQLLELNFKKDSGVSEIKNLTTQTSISGKGNASTEIKTLHVNAQKLDLLVNQLGELIITKIKTEKNLDKIDAIKNANENCQKDLLKTSNYLRYYNRKYLQSGSPDQYAGAFVKQVFSLLSDITQNVSRTIYDLNSLYRAYKEDDMKMRLIIDEMESMVKNIRVLPISTVFNSFSRMVRDIATEKGKDIDFIIEGKDTCADKKIIEEIKTPLIHILRNAIDHGIESKEDRILAGKDPVGRILLSAKQDDNKVIIEVSDDGQGFNLEKIKDRAVSRGFLTQEDIDSMTDEAIMNIIFWPGFTTGDSITSISGRGIGLDVVKTKISQLNGKVKVISEFGKGSCVHIEIPVTLTTLRVFLVKISDQTFAIPIQMITTFILKRQNEIKTNNGIRSILYNNKIVPLYYLADILGLKPIPREDKETILIIEADEKIIGLVVDRLLGDQDILQKKLSPPLYKVRNISGITNLASGELCLILNMQDILHHDFNKTIAAGNNTKLLSSDVLSYKKILIVDDSVTTRTMIKNILLNIGYTVDAVLDASEALVKLKINHYDLIITDLSMPKIDGYEFIDRLKNDEMYMDIPVIVMSSMEKDKAMKRLKQYNIEGYLQKDAFDQTQFVNMIKVILTEYHNK